jgi:hypothetical protein
MQPAPKGLLPHFRLFALATAGRQGDPQGELRAHLAVYLHAFRTLGGRGFRLCRVRVEISDTEVMERRLRIASVDPSAVRREVRTEVFLDPDALLARYGLQPLRGAPRDLLPALDSLGRPLCERISRVADEVIEPLAAEFPEAEVRLDLSRLEGLGYYHGPCVRITAEDPTGVRLPLVDGGYTRFTGLLLNDGRERLLTTGIGADLLNARFVAK